MAVNGLSQLPEVTVDDLVAEAAGWGVEPGLGRATVVDALERIVDANRRLGTPDSVEEQAQS